MQLTTQRIASLLHDYRQTKRAAQDVHAEMLRLAVFELGIRQKVAQSTNIETFLGGYLVGQDMGESSGRMTNCIISGLLRRSQQTKQNARELRAELLRVAVDELGVEQGAALQSNLEIFFDGYLVGQGVVPRLSKTGT